MSDIIQNLIDFYLEFKSEKSYFEDANFHSFLGEWPNCNIYKPLSKENTIALKASKYAKNWILPEEFVQQNKQKIKEAKLFPVAKWTNMYLKREHPFTENTIPDFTISKLTEQEVIPFSEIVNASFNKKILSEKAIIKQMQNERFLFVVGKLNQKTVSTAVFYQNKNTIGLYFIATKKEFQKKGYAGQTIQKGMNYFFKDTPARFVLHATEAGKKLYEKTGFTAENNLRIFVKI